MKLNKENENENEKNGSSYIGYLATRVLFEAINPNSLNKEEREAVLEAVKALYIISEKAQELENLESEKLSFYHFN